MSYIQNSSSSNNNSSNSGSLPNAVSFAVVIMEMVDSTKAGVAFSANLLNSDRDELVVDSSFGLGESVVDGSVSADRYIYDKMQQKVLEKQIGTKTQEKRLRSNGGIETVEIPEAKQNEGSLTDQQLHEVAKLVCIVEKEYGMPMDVEWAYTKGDSSDNSINSTLQLKLLQARPIPTLFCIDDSMMTKPGEKRTLYYDYNIVADATTTAPFTNMDMEFYGWASSAMMGFPDRDIFTKNPNMPIFKASTRQYINVSIFLKFLSPN
jgi:pyruvate,water dikinase